LNPLVSTTGNWTFTESNLTSRVSVVLIIAVVATGALGSPEMAEAKTASASLDVSASVLRNCTIATEPMAFGSYNVLDPSPIRPVGTVTLLCGPQLGNHRGRIQSVAVNMDRGSVAPSFDREMASGVSDGLGYNLYLEPAGNLIWGDGTQGTTRYFNHDTSNNSPVVIPVYGRVHAQQDVAFGNYFDRVTVTLEILD
jgi:spore coat protein U-like protein